MLRIGVSIILVFLFLSFLLHSKALQLNFPLAHEQPCFNRCLVFVFWVYIEDVAQFRRALGLLIVR